MLNLQVFTLFACILCGTRGDKCLTPAKEGSFHAFEETFTSLEDTFQWKTGNSINGIRGVIKCDIPTSSSVKQCVDIAPFPNQYSGTTQKKSGGYKTTMTIKSVTRPRDETTWWWFESNTVLKQCDLEIYSIQSDPSCNNIQVGSNTVSWQCNISNFYPEPLCQFEFKKDDENYQTVPSNHINEGTPTPSGNPVYYSRSCTMNVPVSTLQHGIYTFKVTMYPDMTGTSPSLGKSTSDYVTLSLPVASIKDCPSGTDVKYGYIKEGTTATCQCHLTDVGIPPGQPQWVDSKGTQLGQYEGSSGSLSLTVAYHQGDGPGFVTVTINGENDKSKFPNFNFCETTATLPVSCDMASDDVNPKPNVMLQGIGTNSITLIEETNPLNTYRYKFTVNPKNGGILTLKCVATNSIFSDLTTQDEGTITIQAPPTSHPVMSVDNGVINGGVKTVISGQRLVVKCRVDGGYPVVSKVTTTCTGRQNVANGVDATQTLDVDKDMNQRKCSCVAEHVTGCYDKTTEFTLNVQYIPTVNEYRVNSQPQTLEVNDGGSVTFSCKAEGNPRPSMSIRGQRSMELLTLQDTDSGDYQKTSYITKAMRCIDTDTYICMADNSVGDGMETNVSVFVKCTPQLSSHGVTQEFEMTNATDLEISIDIIGYPEPTGYTLTKVKSSRRRRRAVTGYVVDESLYSVRYSPKRSPEGTVVLRMVDLLDGDSGQYGLTIENGIGNGLVFMFNVTIVPESVSCDDESYMGTAVGVAVGCCLLLSTLMFILGMQVEKRCKCLNKKPHKMLKPSPDYDDFNVPPLQEAYVDVDSIQLQEARRQHQQQQGGGDEIPSLYGDQSNNPTPEYYRCDDGYERPFQDGDNTTNPTYEYLDIDGQATVNSHSNDYTNITPTSKPSNYANVSME